MFRPFYDDSAATGWRERRYLVGDKTIALFTSPPPFSDDPRRQWAGMVLEEDRYSNPLTLGLKQMRLVDDLVVWSDKLFSNQSVFLVQESDIQRVLTRLAESAPDATS